MKNLFNNILLKLIQLLTNLSGASINQLTMKGGLLRAKKRNILPKTIIDVGAAEGNWSLDATKYWPKSNFLMLEPLIERKSKLDKLCKQFDNFFYVQAGAGSKKEEIDFYVTSDLDGSGIADNGTNSRKIKIPITTIDAEIERLKLTGPYLLKLDTHGFEVPILEGAVSTLKETSMVIIECYGLRIAPNSLLFWEMCQYMEKKGFRLLEMVDVVLREHDHAFWQCDAFFIPSDNSIFNKTTYH
jgi:FkbM family methyltransferase